MADDLKVTIGGDATNLEAAAAKAGKNVSKEFDKIENPFQDMADQFGSFQGIGQLIGGQTGAMIGAFADAFGGIISGMIGKIKELADYAQMLRRTSLTTGLSVGQIRELEGISYAFGVSVESMAKTIVEFNKKMGEARIRGGEVTNVLAKMGVGLKDVAEGQFSHQEAMKMLAESYAAGTDEATLLYYGTQLMGDGFKELLPIIKAGSKAVEESMDTLIEADETSAGSLGRFGQTMSNLGRSLENVMINLVGSILWVIEEIQYGINTLLSLGFYNPFESLNDKVKRYVENAPTFMTDDEIRQRVKKQLSGEDQEDVDKALDEALSGGRGKVLSPFGMAPALASQMQQMGGGDIFGAIAATPLDRIVKATEETASNTRPKPAGDSPPATPTPVAR